MARVLVVVHDITRFAVTPHATGTAGDTVNGLWLPNDGATFLRATSTAPGTQTISVLIPGGVDTDLTAGPREYDIPAGSTGSYMGFFPVDIYGTELLLNTSSALLKVAAYSFLA
jgi:hypothetical protein